MNIYFCHELDELYGLYVIAKTRGRAKAIYAAEEGCEYTAVRTITMRINVNETAEGVLLDNDPQLKKYDLEYYDLEYTEEEY